MGSPAPAAHPALPPFNPPPELTDQVLDDLADPDTTLRAIAHRHGASLESLTLWLARPDIAERVALIESAVARRTRLVATNFLPGAVKTAARILDEYNDEESHIPVRPTDVQAREQRRRSRETARRAAALLLRLARFEPVTSTGIGLRPASPRATDPRSPRSGSVPMRDDLAPAIALVRATDRPESSEAGRCDRATASAATPAPTPPDLRCEISNLKSTPPEPAPEECHGQGVPAPLAPNNAPRTPNSAPPSPVRSAPAPTGHRSVATGEAPSAEGGRAQPVERPLESPPAPAGAKDPAPPHPYPAASPDPTNSQGAPHSPHATDNHDTQPHPPPPFTHCLSPPA